jgi:hypothetical protein
VRADVSPLSGVYCTSRTRQTMRVTLDIRETDLPATLDVRGGQQQPRFPRRSMRSIILAWKRRLEFRPIG